MIRFTTIVPLVVVLFALASPIIKAESTGDPVRVVIDGEYYPYEFLDHDGEIKGFTPELLSTQIGRAHV